MMKRLGGMSGGATYRDTKENEERENDR